MTKDEMKDKYSAFITEISEIMGLGKPIDIIKLCATTDLFFRPLEKRIADLEKENAELKKKLKPENCLKLLAKKGYVKFTSDNLTKARHLIRRYVKIYVNPYPEEEIELRNEAEQFLKEVSE